MASHMTVTDRLVPRKSIRSTRLPINTRHASASDWRPCLPWVLHLSQACIHRTGGIAVPASAGGGSGCVLGRTPNSDARIFDYRESERMGELQEQNPA